MPFTRACQAERNEALKPSAAFVEGQRRLELLRSFWAPLFRALETYGDVPEAFPTVEGVCKAGLMALTFQRELEVSLASELDNIESGRTRHNNPDLAADDTRRSLAKCRDEQARIQDVLASLNPQSIAAE